jgi:hypothetical protein
MRARENRSRGFANATTSRDPSGGRSMIQLSLRWTFARMEAWLCLRAARLAVSAARGLGSLGLLSSCGVHLAFRASSWFTRVSMRIWRRARTRRRNRNWGSRHLRGRRDRAGREFKSVSAQCGGL